MMTKEEVAEVVTYCNENNISYKQRLSELGISDWSFYSAKCKYAQKEEGDIAVYASVCGAAREDEEGKNVQIESSCPNLDKLLPT